MRFWVVILLIYVVDGFSHKDLPPDYLSKRENLIRLDSQHRLGNDVQLSENEEKVDKLLLALKKKELDLAFATDKSLQERNFILARDDIEKSDVFKIIREMPKGGVLHIHDLSMASYRRLITKWTYDDRCFMCFNESSLFIKFQISNKKPNNEENGKCLWTSVNAARNNSSSVKAFDDMLLSLLTFTPNDMVNLKDQNALWKKFESIFVALDGLITFHEAFKDYYYYALEELLEDNIQYVEIRALLHPLYYSNGTVTNGGIETLRTYIEITEEFCLKNKQFYGAKFIFSVLRSLSKNVIEESIIKALDMQKQLPQYFGGFDLVGQEDSGFPLLHFINELLLPKQIGKEMPYIFHAGETDWQGESVDLNLFDALLLNTSRIGHGFAITKHPYLMNEAKRRNISIELCPISNQVLGLVADLRDHPASVLFSEDQPITVSPDDPAIWGASGVSYDLYEVLMAMTPEQAGLRVLKKLALNSIRYSILEDSQRESLLQLWMMKWEIFINNLVNQYQL